MAPRGVDPRPGVPSALRAGLEGVILTGTALQVAQESRDLRELESALCRINGAPLGSREKAVAREVLLELMSPCYRAIGEGDSAGSSSRNRRGSPPERGAGAAASSGSAAEKEI